MSVRRSTGATRKLASLNKILSLRDRVTGASMLKDLLLQVKETVSEAYAHQKLPFDRLRKLLAAALPDPVSPLFRVAVLMEQINDVASLERLLPDVTWIVSRADEQIHCRIEYNAELLQATSVQAFGEACIRIASALVADPGARVGELALLAPERERELLHDFNASGREYPRDCTIHELFEREAGRSGEKTAVLCGSLELSYQELNRRANRLAHHLRRLGVGAGARVGILLDHSPEAVVAILAVLKAGGAYVPFDPSSPAERLAFMLADAEIAVLLTQDRLAQRCNAGEAVVLRLDADQQLFAQENTEKLPAGAMPQDVAYIIYTSGSTGRPKGVLISHSSLVNYIWWSKDVYLRGETLAFPLYSSLAFDLTITSFFTPLVTGNRLVIHRPEEGRTSVLGVLQDDRVEILKLTPSHLALIQDRDNRGSSIRRLIVGGEALESGLARRVYESFGGEVEIFNEYGPTEATVGCMIHRFDPEAQDCAFVPIGRPAANTRIYLLGKDLKPVGMNAPGELYISGDGVAQGYWRRDDLTAERFLADPFHAGGRMYKTGDLARWLPEGVIDFLGRKDGQIKFLGHRIELDEIRWALGQHRKVRDSVVSATEDENGNRVLLAYYVAREALDVAELRSFLSSYIPEETIPSFFVHMKRLPLTLNGKLNHQALPSLSEAKKQLRQEIVAPRNATELRVAEIFRQVLGLQQVGIHESFFTLGGHSLLATQVTSRVRDGFHLELPLRALFETPTVADLAARIDAAGNSGHELKLPPLVRCPRDGDLPLSFAQQRLWFIHQLEPESPAYNIPAAVRLTGRLDQAALLAALGEVVARHETLRTSFGEVGGKPVQRIAPPAQLAAPLLDLTDLPTAQREAETRRLVTEEERHPFDLARGPLVRVALLRLACEDHVLLLTLHHIVSDGWSTGVLIREFGALYPAFHEGRPSPLPLLPVQYADFALWQQTWMSGEALTAQLSYWLERLEGIPAEIELPTDHPRLAVPSGRGGSQLLRLPRGLSDALAKLGARHGATLFMTLLAAWKVLLSRYSGQTDVVVGSPIANRNRTELESLIGFFVNTLALRTDLSGGPDFRDLVGKVREVTLSAYAHQDLPFERLVEEMAPERVLSRTPIFQVVFALQNAPASTLDLPGLTLSRLVLEGGTAKFNLMLSLAESEAGLAGSLEFSRDLFDPATVACLAGHFQTLLAAIALDPARRTEDLPLLSPEEQGQLLVEWNRTAGDYPREATLPELFQDWASRTPEAVAVVFGDEELTYRELSRRARRVARRLRTHGVGPEVLVGLCADRGADLVAGMLGVLAAGGAYVPLDPTYPRERLAFMLEDAATPVVLVQGSWAERLPASRAELVILEEAVRDESMEEARERALPVAWAESLAYVMYTSGSTGRPKGVAVSHRAIVRLVRDTDYTQVEPSDRMAQVASSSFDAATFEIWGALLNGACLVGIESPVALSPGALATCIAEQRISALFLTTALFQQIAREAPEAFRPLRHLLFGGEVVDPRWVREVLKKGAPERLLHVYGPTENTTFSSWYLVEQVSERATSVPIGRPIRNTRAYVLDGHLRPVPVGVSGDLYLGGDGLARDYHNRPDLTAERFVPDPSGYEPGGRLYQTGDRARHLVDGTIDFLGRLDHQVKLRGFRIELGDVEAALAELPGVRQALVVVRPGADGSIDKRLVAYVAGEAESAELRRHLETKLPSFMIPSAFVVLPSFPLTSNGKVDRQSLPEPEWGRAEAEVDSKAPCTPVEEMLAGIFAEVLGLSRVGVRESFFDLGGHSLLATQVVSRIRAAFGIELPLRVLFEAPTVEGLAPAVEAAMRSGMAPVPPIVPMERDGELPLSFAQQRLWFIHQLEPESPAYNIPVAVRLTGRLDRRALRAALCGVAARHETLRTTFGDLAGEPVQRIAPPVLIAVALIDLADLPAEALEAEARRLIAEEERRPFDLTHGPLLRVELLRLDEQEHALLLTLHHIISDGWSMGVLIRELATLYAAHIADRPSPLPPLTVQYVDFALWQREWMRGQVLEGQLRYWRERLEGAPRVLELPADRPRPAVASGQGGLRSSYLPAEIAGSLSALAQRQGATLFMIALAAWKALLSRLTGQNDLVVGTPIANRNRSEVEALIGLFVNTLALRTELPPSLDFLALVRRIREATLGALAHQDLPFERLVEELSPERSLAHTPLFQVMLAVQNASHEVLDLPGLTLSPLRVEMTTAKLDLSLTLGETPAGLAAHLEFNRDLFDAATADRLLGHLETLLAAAVDDPGCRVVDLPLLREAERRQLLAAGRAAAPVDLQSCLHGLFEAQARREPDAVAAVCEGRSLSYGELDRRATRLAYRLRRLGVGPEVPVGVCLASSLELVTGLVAVLAAGGVYLPLDPAYPRERLAFMLKDAGAPAVLTLERLAESLPGEAARLLCLDAPVDADAEDLAAPRHSAAPQSLAYLIYTSGSTGRPKAVGVEHGPAAGHMLAAARLFGLDRGDRVLQLASPSFDTSLEEILPALISGAVVVLRGPELWEPAAFLDKLAQLGITVLDIPTAYWHQWVVECEGMDRPADLGLRTVAVGGEAMSPEAARLWWRTPLADIPLLNTYGPTEAIVTSTWLRVDREAASSAAGSVRIGRPLAGRDALVLDRAGSLAPVNVPGELYLAGLLLARGYRGRPDLTAERFVPDPYASLPGARLYRSGDLARWRPDGTLEFLGRADQQVKIRGFRVEPGEIEAALAGHPKVRESVVLAREDVPGETRLAAYLVARPEALLTAAELRDHLRRSLPEHMIPAAFVVLDALPRTSNGKLDRKALPAPGEPRAGERGASSPRTITEEILAGLWQEILRLDCTVGIHESFFELGGHSLLATRMLSRIRGVFEVDLPLRTVFESPTVSGLAALVEEGKRTARGMRIPPFEPVAARVEVPLSFSQQRLWFMDQLEPGNPFYNVAAAFDLEGPLDLAVLERSLSEIVRRQGSLRTVFARRSGQNVQRVQPPAPVILPIADLSILGEEAQQAEVRRLVSQEARASFDLARGPLFRIRLLRLGESRHVFLLTLHHIITDGWSTDVLTRELVELYESFSRGESSPLADLPLQYTDFAVWQQQWLRGEALETQLAYWRRQLADAPAVTRLPTDRPRPAVQSYRGGRQRFELSAEPCQRLRELSRREGVSLFMTVLAAYQAFLSSCAGEEVVIVGSPVSYRNWAEVEGLIGFFANTLLFRGDVAGNPSFRELLGRVRKMALDAFAHEHVPFDKLVSELRPERNLGYNPLFQVGFAFQTAAETSRGRSDLLVRPFGFELETTQFDLNLAVIDTGAKLVGDLQFSRDLFEEITVDLMREQLQELMQRVGSDPEIRMNDLRPLLAEVSRRRLGALKREAARPPHRASGVEDDRLSS